ncbi:DUF427 domain-containing protein [Nocardioides panacisoli]|uniref:DUF427 domain-containing protein n=1 Tax=Nocardioides panacisoli TaxID=627624 RepID=UPI0031E350A3
MRKPRLTPGPSHPITVTANPRRVTVRVAGRTIADTSRAQTLQESSYPAVLYVPREDADLTLLEPTDHRTYCPYKGDASYFSIRTEDGTVKNAVWSYETPYDAVPEIAGHLAFYPDKVEVTEH